MRSFSEKDTTCLIAEIEPKCPRQFAVWPVLLLQDAAPAADQGGLAPHLCRRVTEYIEAELDQPLRLRELAALAGMSAFHFQRVFRTSHGVSPQGWILRRCIERARAQLRGDAPIA